MSSVDEGCRRRKKETGRIVSLSRNRPLARSHLLSLAVYEKTQRSRRLYLSERLTVRSVSGGPSATVAPSPPPPPLPHCVTLELSVEGHTARLYTRTRVHSHTHKCVRRCEKQREKTRKGKERGVARAVGTEENVSRIPPPSPPSRQLILSLSLLLFFLFRPLRRQ